MGGTEAGGRALNDGTVSGQYSQEPDTAVTAVKTNEERRLEYMTLALHDITAHGDDPPRVVFCLLYHSGSFFIRR